MSLDAPHSSHNGPDQSQESPLSGSFTSGGNGTAGTLQEDKEHRSSQSQQSSPKLPSILLQPSVAGVSRPRPSEARVGSLNLPKHSPQFPRQNASHPSSLGPSRRRIVSNTHTNKEAQAFKDSTKGKQLDDGLFTFGVGDDYTLEPEDPEVLADVQRALDAKAIREARSKSGASTPNASGFPMNSGSPDDVQLFAENSSQMPSQSPAFSFTPPKHVASALAHITPTSAVASQIIFPPYIHSSRSLGSISSSESHSGQSPIPVLISLPDGSFYLDWSGAPPKEIVSHKDRRFLGRTFSLTKRKGRGKDRRKGTTGRHSVDLEASQRDLHAAQLDNIRRSARRETLSRAETTKDELGRRYNSLFLREITGEPTLDLLGVVKSPHVESPSHTPWLAWCRKQVVGLQKPNAWTITANSVDAFLQKSGRSPPPSFVSPSKPITMLSQRSHSPSHGLSSSFSSRSSLSTSPNHNDLGRRDRRHLELSRSLSANPVIEGVASASLPVSPTLYRSLSLTQAPTFIDLSPSSTTTPRRSIDAMVASNHATSSFSNLTRSQSSLDPGSRPPVVSGATTAEKDSFRKRVRLSLTGDKFPPPGESRTSTISSLANMFSTTQTTGSGAPIVSSRLHLGVPNLFGMVKRGGEESGTKRKGHPRSSASEERDSGRDGEGTKSDDPTGRGQGRTRTAPIIDGRGKLSRGKNTPNTSDSDPGRHLGGRLVQKLQRADKDRDRAHSAEETTEEVRGSISGSDSQRWLADAFATPGWTSKRGVRRPRASASKEISRERQQRILRKQVEDEEHAKEVYKAREAMLIETNDHNRRIARLLKVVATSIKEHEAVQLELAQSMGAQYRHTPQEIMDAIGADPATTLRHGRGWQAVEDSYRRFITQQALLGSYLATLSASPEPELSSDLDYLIQEADQLWHGLRIKNEEIEKKCAVVKPALETATAHMEKLQMEYNETHILAETDYPEQTRIADLETIITESRSPRGWLEFAAFWIPELVLELIGGFIRFFGVSISEKFIRPFLWYFFRNRYYWKIYSTEPPPSERAWYTRLGYWVVILSILAWYTTA